MLQVAWPAGNSGTVAFFSPKNGINGTLALKLLDEGQNRPIGPIYYPTAQTNLSRNASGIGCGIHMNSSAVLDLAIMGSIRTIRDFTEGPSILVPEIQNAIEVRSSQLNTAAYLSRLWLDNVTTTRMTFTASPNTPNASVFVNGKTLEFSAGNYLFTAYFDYPRLTQLSAAEDLAPEAQGLIEQQPQQTNSLSFLSYTEKLLAGAWRFLTYFGRDSMITLLLMQPVLSEGEGGAIEAVIGAVLERLNYTDGKVCHEETIGDYATYQNMLNNITSTAPGCTYQMVDTDFYLAPVMEHYFLNTATGKARRDAFFAKTAMLDFGNQGRSYAELALRNADKVIRSTEHFAFTPNKTKDHLVHLEKDQLVGEWRDSTYGIGGGRIPYDVNTALAPAALRSIAALSAAGFFPERPEWHVKAAEYALVWEDYTLQFFEVVVPETEAKSLVTQYASGSDYGFPSNAEEIDSDVVYHGLSLDGNNNQLIIKVMNTDDSFRHFLLNTTNQTQLTSFVNSTANNILKPFPVGLSNPVGLLVANPAYGGNPVYVANWTNNAYHGTVVWSWPMAMMAAGLQRQLHRCNDNSSAPDFCRDGSVHSNVLAAYNHLWDLIEANKEHLSTEVWSWQYRGGGFEFVQLGALPPPPGQSPTESDIVQLWSLTFLAVTRDDSLK